MRNIIAIDLDGTWTLNPRAFNEIYVTLTEAGFEVWLVTARHPQDINDLTRYNLPARMAKIFTAGKPKECIEKAFNIKVLFWVDNEPRSIIDMLGLTDDSTL